MNLNKILCALVLASVCSASLMAKADSCCKSKASGVKAGVALGMKLTRAGSVEYTGLGDVTPADGDGAAADAANIDDANLGASAEALQNAQKNQTNGMESAVGQRNKALFDFNVFVTYDKVLKTGWLFGVQTAFGMSAGNISQNRVAAAMGSMDPDTSGFEYKNRFNLLVRPRIGYSFGKVMVGLTPSVSFEMNRYMALDMNGAEIAGSGISRTQVKFMPGFFVEGMMGKFVVGFQHDFIPISRASQEVVVPGRRATIVGTTLTSAQATATIYNYKTGPSHRFSLYVGYKF